MMKTQHAFPILFCAALLGICRAAPVARAEESGGDPTRLVFGLACQPAGWDASAITPSAMADHCVSGKPLSGAVMLVSGKAAAVTNELGQFVVKARPHEVITVSPASASGVSIPPQPTVSQQIVKAVNALLSQQLDMTSVIGMLLVISIAAIGLLLHSVSQGLARVAQAAEALGHDERQSRVERELKRDALRVVAERIADLTGQPVTLHGGTGVVTVTANPPSWKAVSADGREFYFSLRPRLEPSDRRVSIPRHRQADVAAMWRFLAEKRGHQVAVPTRARWTLVIRDPGRARSWTWGEWVRARRITKAAREALSFGAGVEGVESAANGKPAAAGKPAVAISLVTLQQGELS